MQHLDSQLDTSTMQIVCYDGDCGFCNKSVQLIWQRDTEGLFHFVSIQSPTGRALLAQHHIPEPNLTTFYLIAHTQVFSKSAAALCIMQQLNGLKWLARLAKYVPRVLADWLYDRIAAHRYRFSRSSDSSCTPPPDEVKKRFLA